MCKTKVTTLNISYFNVNTTPRLVLEEELESHHDINRSKGVFLDKVKLLRITIDQKLKFDKHIDNLCKNAAR